MLEYFKADYYRMTGEKFSLKSIPFILIKHNLKYMFYFRISQNTNIKLVKKIIRARLYLLGRKYGIEILPTTKIGPGFYIGHPYNITINQGSVIGKKVEIKNGTVILFKFLFLKLEYTSKNNENKQIYIVIFSINNWHDKPNKIIKNISLLFIFLSLFIYLSNISNIKINNIVGTK